MNTFACYRFPIQVLLLSALIFNTAFALADEPFSAEVKQVFADRKKAAAVVTPAAEVGQEFVATFENGDQCALKVTDFRNGIATLDTSGCVGKGIKPGLKLEKSLLAVGKEEAGVSEVKAEVKAEAKTQPPVAPEQSVVGQRPTLRDLTFMPAAGQFVIASAFAYYAENTRAERNGSTFFDSSTSTQGLAFGVQYGVLDNLAVAVTMKAALADTIDFTYGPASSINGTKETYKSSGFYDPSLDVTFRFLEQGVSPISGYLDVQFAPSVFPAKTSSTTADGTEGSGGNQYSVALKLDAEQKWYGLGVGVSYAFADKRVTEGASSGQKSESTGGNKVTVGVNGLFKANKVFAISAGLRVASNQSAELKNTSTGLVQSFSNYNYVELATGVRAEVIPGRLLLAADVSAVPPASTTDQVGAVSIDIKSTWATYMVGMMYGF